MVRGDRVGVRRAGRAGSGRFTGRNADAVGSNSVELHARPWSGRPCLAAPPQQGRRLEKAPCLRARHTSLPPGQISHSRSMRAPGGASVAERLPAPSARSCRLKTVCTMRNGAPGGAKPFTFWLRGLRPRRQQEYPTPASVSNQATGQGPECAWSACACDNHSFAAGNPGLKQQRLEASQCRISRRRT